MGCDICGNAERQVNGRWERIDNLEPFDARSYATFGFLAGVRNYSAVLPIAEPRGLPDDASAAVKEDYESWGDDAHTPSWLTVAELAAFNYDAEMEDRRYTRQDDPNSFNGGAPCEAGRGKRMTWREFLGEWFFKDLQELQDAGADRIVFWFDN